MTFRRQNKQLDYSLPRDRSAGDNKWQTKDHTIVVRFYLRHTMLKITFVCLFLCLSVIMASRSQAFHLRLAWGERIGDNEWNTGSYLTPSCGRRVMSNVDSTNAVPSPKASTAAGFTFQTNKLKQAAHWPIPTTPIEQF